MPAYFLDSSALAKRYVAEIGTSWVQSLFDPAFNNRLDIIAVCGVEVVATIARRRRAGSLSIVDCASTISELRRDPQRDFRIVQVNAAIIDDAMSLADRQGMQGYDALQLAGALAIRSQLARLGIQVTLVSSDLELNTAARAEGLVVEDPNEHP